MISDEPAFLPLGTEVSAKFKGAFCEAKIKKVSRNVRVKILFKDSAICTIDDNLIRGVVKPGSSVEAIHPQTKQYQEALVQLIKDHSTYTVTFNDGDIRTLKRAHVCPKGVRHFSDTLSLDAMPLTHPEQFGAPVRKRRKSGSSENTGDNDDSSVISETCAVASSASAPSSDMNISASSSSAVASGSGSMQRRMSGSGTAVPNLEVGHVVCVFEDKEKKKWFPALIVTPRAHGDPKIRRNKHFCVRSFKDGRDLIVPKKSTKAFTPEAFKNMDHQSLKPAVEKALLYVEKDELPIHWDHDLLLNAVSSSESSASDDDDISDTEPSEEKDRFVAQLYKFMDERGSPINKAPMIAGQDLDLYRLYYLVQNLGGYNKVCNNSDWKTVLERMKLQNPLSVTPSHVKNCYNKYLSNFDSFNKKLGFAVGDRGKQRRARPTAAFRSSLQARSFERNRTATAKSPTLQQIKAALDEESRTNISTEVAGDTKDSITVATTNILPLSVASTAKDEFKKKLARSFMIRTAASRRDSVMPNRTPERSISPPECASDSGTESSSRSLASRTLNSPREHRRSQAAAAGDEWQVCEDDPEFKAGQSVRVKYVGKKRSSSSHEPLYEAKILRIEESKITDERRYLIHYCGWNTRFDEFVSRERINALSSSSMRINALQDETTADNVRIKRPSGAAISSLLAADDQFRDRHASSESSCSFIANSALMLSATAAEAAAHQSASLKCRRRRASLCDLPLSSSFEGDGALIDVAQQPTKTSLVSSGRHRYQRRRSKSTAKDSAEENESDSDWEQRLAKEDIASVSPLSATASSRRAVEEVETSTIPAEPSASSVSPVPAVPHIKGAFPTRRSKPTVVAVSRKTLTRRGRKLDVVEQDSIVKENSSNSSQPSRQKEYHQEIISETHLDQISNDAANTVEFAAGYQISNVDQAVFDVVDSTHKEHSVTVTLVTQEQDNMDLSEQDDQEKKSGSLVVVHEEVNAEGCRKELNATEKFEFESSAMSPTYSGGADEREILRGSGPLLKSRASRTGKKKRRRHAACPFPTQRRQNRTPRHQTEFSDNDDGGLKDPGSAGGMSPAYHSSNSTAALKSRIQQQMENDPNYKSKYQFNVIHPELKGEQLIRVVQERIAQIREVYTQVKSDLQQLERKRRCTLSKKKRHQMREKEKEQQLKKETLKSKVEEDAKHS